MAMFVLVLTQCDQPAKAKSASTPNAELIGQLSSSDPEVVSAAAKKISELGPKAEDAIPALLKKLGSNNAIVDIYTGQALVAIGEKAARAMLDSNDKNVIDQYSLVLSKFDNVALIIGDEMLRSKNNDKVFNLLLTLSIMGEKAKPALPAIGKMKSRANGNPAFLALLETIETTMNEGVGGLERLEKESKQRLDGIKDERAENFKDFRKVVDKALVFNFNLNPPATAALMAKHPKMESAMPEINRLLVSESMEDRVVACATLWNYCIKDAKNTTAALPKIKQLCSEQLEKEELVRLLSSVAVLKLGDQTDYSPRYIKALKDCDDLMEVLCGLAGLVELKTNIDDQNCLASLAAFMASEKPEVSSGAALVLLNSEMYDLVKPYAEGLLSSPTPVVRFASVAMLVKIGSKSKTAIPALRQMMALEKDPQAKSFIDMAIRSINESQGAKEESSLEGDSSRLAQAGELLKMRSLSPAEKKKAIPSLLAMISGNDKDLGALAMSTLCSFDALAEPASDDLIRLLKKAIVEKDDDVQFLIAGVLGEINKPEFAPTLLSVLKDGDSRTSLSAYLALQKLGSNAKSIVPDLLKLAKMPNHRDNALTIIESVGAIDNTQLEAVTAFLADQNGMATYHAQKIIVAQGTKVALPIFEAALTGKDLAMASGGFSGMILLGRVDPTAVTSSLDKVKFKIANKALVGNVQDLIKELRAKK
jgi:HEAT repeat protein